ncbi:hypothetical protein [Streptomyces sp. WMMC940]|uniref:hypothetical protein n=1 Tax=Streptomyces sp. WMMC940 TaxID=3015153 RepID=UPI0022B67AE3|nr:hypothetical protein [Streptomyces sp. WMMC940]MCZ7459642.1 hypothetical protein [Streptomyces sp. WMMC940]
MAGMTGWREEFAGLMERAGLEIVGDRPGDEGVLPPRTAWRPVAAMGTEPALVNPTIPVPVMRRMAEPAG